MTTIKNFQQTVAQWPSRFCFRKLPLLLIATVFALFLTSAKGDSAGAPASDVIIKNNDLVRITVFEQDDLLTEARVSKSGQIILPLLGPVHLAGLTIEQAMTLIHDRLDKRYILNPQVTVTILDYAKAWVTVLGEVQKPGTVEIPAEGNLDLLGAIALAGGYTKVAAPDHITVRRNVDGADKVLRIDGRELAKNTSVKVFYVRPGDTIMVGESVF
jgi:protein involved in polysaccharide export with SLBB domain